MTTENVVTAVFVMVVSILTFICFANKLIDIVKGLAQAEKGDGYAKFIAPKAILVVAALAVCVIAFAIAIKSIS